MMLWAATLATVGQAPIYMFIMQAIALSPDKQSESNVPWLVPPFGDKKTEAHRDKITCLGSSEGAMI